MNIRKTLFLLIVITVLLNQAYSQVTSIIQTKTARSTALAASQVALSESAELLFISPALLSEYVGMGVVAGYQNVFSQSFLNHTIVGLAYDTGSRLGNFGFTSSSLNTKNGQVSLADESVLGLHYGTYLMKDRLSSLSLGISLNYLEVSYGQSAGPSGDGSDGVSLGSTSRIGIDIGLMATLGKKHRVAAVVKNINQPAIGSAGVQNMLPQTIIGGFAYTPVEEVVTTFSLNYSSGYPVEFHGGLEYKLSPKYSIMTGMQSQPNRLSAGIKLDVKGVILEYGVITHPVLPLTHAISMNFHFEDLYK